ncbi:n-acetylglucosamine-6-phosphate deacetylase, partial [Aspergillus sclerotialis]
TLKIAYSAHPEGAILVTDAQKFAGCPDGAYEWRGEDRFVKEGKLLKLESNGRIAGSVVDLIDCVNNFKRNDRGREDLLPKIVHYGGHQPPTPPSP